MAVDWHLVAEVTVPIVCLFIGAWVNRRFERRPSLISYYGHVAAFQHTLPDGNKVSIFTHTVVVRNAGKMSAANVRIRHKNLPSFQIFPTVDYAIHELPDGTKEIVVPKMIPTEQFTISYLYFPPLNYTEVNTDIRSDEGFARQIPMVLQRQYPTWWGITALVVFVIGVGTCLYVLAEVVKHFLAP